MFSVVNQALRDSFKHSKDFLIEYHAPEDSSSRELLDSLAAVAIIQPYSKQDLHESVFNLKYLHSRVEYLISLEGEKYYFEPTGNDHEVIERDVSSFTLYKIDAVKFFHHVAKLNNFFIPDQQVFGSDVFCIGEMFAAGKKIAWFYSDGFSKDVVSSLTDIYDYIILSSSKSIETDYSYLPQIFLQQLTLDSQTWLLKIDKIITSRNQFSVEDLSKAVNAKLVFDHANERIFLLGRDVASKGSRHANFIISLIKAGKGLSKASFSKFLKTEDLESSDFREIIKKDRHALKKHIINVFADNDDLKAEALHILNLVNTLGKKASMKLNLSRKEMLEFN